MLDGAEDNASAEQQENICTAPGQAVPLECCPNYIQWAGFLDSPTPEDKNAVSDRILLLFIERNTPVLPASPPCFPRK